MAIEIPTRPSISHESLTQTRIRNKNLPPPEYVPILREYGRLGLNRFQEIYGMPTPTDDRGFVNYDKALDYIDSHVKEGYHWQEDLEVHHLLHESGKYDPSNFNENEYDQDGDLIDPELPGRVRENPFDKIIIHGDRHDLWHVLLIPPERPDYMHLKQRYRSTSIAMSLFQHAKQVIDIEEKEGKFQPMDHPLFADSMIDSTKRRVMKRGVLLAQYVKSTEKFHEHLKTVDLDEIKNLIDTNALNSNNPIESIVLDMTAKLSLSGSKRGIKPQSRSASQKAA